MRFKLFFDLENEKFPINYRRNILSFIKLSLSNYDNEYFKKLYNEKDNIIKPYTFSVYFNNAIFTQESIIIKDKKFELTISIEDCEIAIILYNSFNHQKHKKFSINNNSWILENISMLIEKTITTNKIDIKFMSPLIVRERKERKDYYYSYSHEKFIEILKINIKEQLKITNLPVDIIETFNIKPINPKKIIVKFYEKKMESTIGIFNISGDKRLLDYIYKAGMGSRRSSGFGMFQII